MTGIGTSIAKFVGVAVVVAVPTGMVLGSYTTGHMRRDYLYGYNMPSEGSEAEPVPYVVPKAAKVEQAAIYPAPPPSALPPDSDGFDDQAYLAGYDREQAGGGSDDYRYDDATASSYRDDYADTDAGDGYAYNDARGSDGYAYRERRAGDDRRPAHAARREAEDDPFIAQTRRVDRHRRYHAGRAADSPEPAYADGARPREAVAYADAGPESSRYSVHTPAGTVTVTRSSGGVTVSSPAGVSQRSQATQPPAEDYYSPAD
ncbi:hypothetical protein [Stakelama marina]|uniref:Uncharacterized protein n=1 Tax=Stakelama marina TaxID=2826939 RepID=A0A8T4IG34_9SPHN|nr:hypothetical protein [Stakelama marina]MBR0553563.1 hypothetical protein [Stakelama marina]